MRRIIVSIFVNLTCSRAQTVTNFAPVEPIQQRVDRLSATNISLFKGLHEGLFCVALGLHLCAVILRRVLIIYLYLNNNNKINTYKYIL